MRRIALVMREVKDEFLACSFDLTLAVVLEQPSDAPSFDTLG